MSGKGPKGGIAKGLSRRSRAQKRRQRSLPISSLADVPATDETRQKLASAGLSAFRDQAPISEAEAQAVIAAKSTEESEGGWEPECYGNKHDPMSMLCGGCVFASRCWSRDEGYLAKLKAGKSILPLGVPKGIVDERLATISEKAKPTRRSAPPKRRAPPSRKGK